MNIAEQISALFGDDGQCWTSYTGSDFSDVCGDAAVKTEYRDYGQMPIRYVFKDGSVITAYEECWDLGYTECWCHRENGHQDCDAAQ